MSPSEDAPKDPLDEVRDFQIGLVKTRFDGSEVDLGTAVWNRAAVHPRGLVYEWVPPTVEEADEPGARFTAWAEVVLPERNVRVETEFWYGSGQELADELWLRLLHPLPKGRRTFPPQGVTALLNEALERCDFLEITYDVDPHEKTPYEIDLNRHGGPFVRRRGVTLDEALVLCLVPWRESETARKDPAPEVEDPAEFLWRLQSVLERTAYIGFDYAPGRGDLAFEITVTRNDQCVAVGEGPTLGDALAAAELRLGELQDWSPDFPK